MYVLKVLFFGMFSLAILAVWGVFALAVLDQPTFTNFFIVSGIAYLIWEVLYLIFWGWRFKRKNDRA